MSAITYTMHPITPDLRKIYKIVEALRDGAVILYPTDTGFSLGCELHQKNAAEKIRQLRRMTNTKSLTFLCESLSNISEYAKVSDKAYKTLKSLIPGPYTFLLPASKEVPKLVQDPKKKTTGIRVPENPLCHSLLSALGVPLISSSAKNENLEDHYSDPDAIIKEFGKQVDIIAVSEEYNFVGESTIIDMTDDADYKVIREGAGYDLVEELYLKD